MYGDERFFGTFSTLKKAKHCADVAVKSYGRKLEDIIIVEMEMDVRLLDNT